MTSNKTLPQGVYGITAEQFSCGRSNIEVAEAMIRGGIAVIQYREKRHLKDYKDILAECQAISTMAKEHGVMFIVNDFVDIALLVDADGVHVGQEDLPVPAARKLLGPDKIIGLSTHTPEEVQQAATLGADYIGVGPIYPTQTKDDAGASLGLDFLDYAANHSPLPFTAIGGIKRHNIAEVHAHGARSICLITDIVEAQDIARRVQELNREISR